LHHRPTTAEEKSQELMGWDRQFHDPIPLPSGALRTLRDAGEYIANLPKAEHNAPAWYAATEALLLAIAHGGDTMLARIGIIKALHASRPELPPTPRRKRTYRFVR
jgi:hypothetical protein